MATAVSPIPETPEYSDNQTPEVLHEQYATTVLVRYDSSQGDGCYHILVPKYTDNLQHDLLGPDIPDAYLYITGLLPARNIYGTSRHRYISPQLIISPKDVRVLHRQIQEQVTLQDIDAAPGALHKYFALQLLNPTYTGYKEFAKDAQLDSRPTPLGKGSESVWGQATRLLAYCGYRYHKEIFT